MGEELRRTMITQKFIYKSPIGSLEIISHDGHIKNLNILTDTPPTVGNIIHPEIESALHGARTTKGYRPGLSAGTVFPGAQVLDVFEES